MSDYRRHINYQASGERGKGCNVTHMADRGKHILAEWVAVQGPADDQELLARLAGTACVLNLPPLILDRIVTAVSRAVRRALQRHSQQAVVVSVAVPWAPIERELNAHSWGFFLVEKASEDAKQHRIEVLVYPEGG